MKEIKKCLCVLLIFLFGCLTIWGTSKIDWNPKKIAACPFCDQEFLERQLVHKGTHASVVTTYEAEEMLELVKGVHRKYQSTLQVTDYILIQKNGVLAGQTVPHVHIHILPRSTSINNVSFVCRFFVFSLLKPLDPEQMADYRQAFKF
jgi:hypothetical protein